MPTTKASASICHTRLSISSSEILSLHSTPLTLLPAPGSGKAYTILDVEWVYNYGTTAYDAASADVYLYSSSTQSSGNTWATIDAFAFFGQPTTSQRANKDGSVIDDGTSKVQSSLSDFDNQPIMLSMGFGDPTLGDGTLTIGLTYLVVEL